jgi:glycosyltransferase involved in cell wall biosynthesis
MKLAYFSPFNPQRSGISDYSEELLPHLAKHADIDLFVDGFSPTNRALLKSFRIFDYRRDAHALKRLGTYDAVIYHMGNDHRYHAGIYRAALGFPGIVVLHDFALQPFFLELARERGDMRVYLDEVEACYGSRRRAAVEREALTGEPPMDANPTDFPLNERLARQAEAIIVHSEWSRTRLQKIAPGVPINHINHHVIPRDDSGRPRALHNERSTVVRLASFGHITSEKGIERTLRVLASLREEYDFHYTLVGEQVHYDVDELVRFYNLTDRVTVTGYVTLEEFERRIAETDIAINLRDRTVGETSGSACRIMAAGVPVIVTNIGWFSELPDDAAVKIDPDDDTDARLRASLKMLLEDAALRAQTGAHARRYVLAHHAIEKSAGEYLKFISDVIAQRARRRFIRNISAEMARLGIAETDETFLRRVATEVARLAPAGRLSPAD